VTPDPALEDATIEGPINMYQTHGIGLYAITLQDGIFGAV